MNSRPKIPADGFTLIHGPFGFALVVQQAHFETSDPGVNKPAVLAPVEEIRFSPMLAKQLLHTLAMNIRGYEDNFGEIPLPDMPPPGKSN